jgi:hypothetical protein
MSNFHVKNHVTGWEKSAEKCAEKNWPSGVGFGEVVIGHTSSADSRY